jgi:hypothetical protein
VHAIIAIRRKRAKEGSTRREELHCFFKHVADSVDLPNE